ncbi:MAG TPA: M56 family metallopeptidase [Terriglobales bacterium]|nr:M56 family metallopeptidase [Terriglobales bacterium]
MTALLNHLWQSTAFLALVALLAWLLRSRPASLRFRLWMAASLKFLLPFSVLAWLGGAWLRQAPAAAPAVASVAAMRMIQPFPAAPAMVNFSPLSGPVPGHTAYESVLFALWVAGVLAVLVIGVRRWRALARIRCAGRPVAGLVPTVLTGAGIEPGVFGILHPVLMLPADLEAHLAPGQIEAVVQHELCHIRRRDNLWALLHFGVAAIFWFFPPVWWLGSRLVAERERACDEAVLAAGADPQSYAACMLAVCRFYVGVPAACAAGVAGGVLGQRVRGIMTFDTGRPTSRVARCALATLLGAMLVAAIVAPFSARSLFAQQPAKVQFDVASIHEWGPGQGPPGRFTTGVLSSPGRIYAQCVSLRGLISYAYRLTGSEPIEGLRSWADASCGEPDSRGTFTLEAREPAGTTVDQSRAMMQSLLADRFQLAAHWETRQQPIFELVIAPGGFKLHPSDPEKDPPVPPHSIGCPTTDPHCNIGLCCGSSKLSDVAWTLSRTLGRPVIDKTGLEGFYPFNLMRWAGDDATDSPLPSLQGLLRDEYGLEYRSARGPVPILVVDHVARLRSESQ